MCKQEIGLTTQQALHRLYDDIDSILREFHHSQSTRHTSAWLCDSLHYSSEYTTLTVISVFAIVLIILILLIVEIFITHDSTLFYQAAFLLIFLFINMYLVLSDNKFRHEEVPKRVVSILATIKLAIKNVKWLPENYPHLCSPFSPCVTTQWVYRDGCLINLPWALLVRDDIIVIRPGQLSPGDCKALDENSDCPILNANEVYGPALPTAHEIFSAPKARIPLKNKKYILIETPYIRNLRVALDRALDRPITHFNRQRHLLINKCVEHYCFPIVLVFVIVFNFIRYMYLHKYFGRGHWVEMCVLQPICVILPLLPLVFPTIWLILNAFGMARFKTLFNTTSKKSLMSETQIFAEPDSCVDPDLDFTYQWAEVWDIFVNIISGKELMMTRSSNILHVFGSLSALCVVDKKGILSWPNPTAEKVFFLRSSGSISHSSSLGSMNDSDVDADSIRTSLKHVHNGSLKGTTAEVLDVTHDHKYPFRLEFDDHSWHQYLPSLKPLGLAILLNTCNVETQETYSQFCSHVTCEAMYNENLVPVTNRRCLCELAKQIGFVDKAQEIFSTEEQLSTFRHLTDTIKRDKFVKSLHLSTKLKFPFPHMFAVIVKELNSGTHQLLSQGTADVILDSCIDFWDGKDLCPLSTSDRKKIMDFYQRTSLTAYCTAFAYRPLTRPFDNKLSEIYLELPSDSRHLYMPHRSPTPLHWDFKSMLEPRIKGTLGQFHSTDSLLYNDTKEEAVSDVEGCFEAQCHQVFMGMVTMQYQAQADMVSLIEQLERACVRFVHFSKENELRSRVFSEKMGLESGWNCHISLHSERSRPMRLSDSGPSECWANNGTARISSPSAMPRRLLNRHSETDRTEQIDEKTILVQSTNLDSTKPISFSAPSAINLDYSVVKFEEDVEIGLSGDWADSAEPTHKLTKDNFDGCKIIDSDNKDTESAMEDGDITGSKDSVMVQSVDLSSHQEGWQSLSCLTDSTEQSAPVNFDMSNRAKLPRGIENIRPHLESVDNVPLLVSLFTDCTARVTCEMLKIMQDYGQIVCVLGSAANADNMEIFMQADASIAVEPLYPQVCQRVPVYTPVAPVHGPSPVGLSRSLNAIACSLAFRREDPVSLYHLVLESRHYMLSLWNCVQFWVCCSVSVTFLQLFGIILMLPPIFSSAQVVWLICFIIPLLSISLIGLPTDPLVMQRPAAKFQYSVNTEMVVFVIWCYCAKFLSVIIFTLMSYGGTLVGFCNDIALTTNGTICRILYPFPTNEDTIWLGWGGHSYSLLTVQHLTAFIAVAHLIIVSSTFVHREYSVWYRKPFENKLWISVATMLLIVQVLFSTVALTVFSERNSTDVELTIVDVPWPVLFFMIISFGLTYAVVEFLKWQEIKVNLRYLRRARLDFGTKLGMNSPF